MFAIAKSNFIIQASCESINLSRTFLTFLLMLLYSSMQFHVLLIHKDLSQTKRPAVFSKKDILLFILCLKSSKLEKNLFPL